MSNPYILEEGDAIRQFEIPDENLDDFLLENPTAKKAKKYTLPKAAKPLYIPLELEKDFLNDNPEAKVFGSKEISTPDTLSTDYGVAQVNDKVWDGLSNEIFNKDVKDVIDTKEQVELMSAIAKGGTDDNFNPEGWETWTTVKRNMHTQFVDMINSDGIDTVAKQYNIGDDTLQHIFNNFEDEKEQAMALAVILAESKGDSMAVNVNYSDGVNREDKPMLDYKDQKLNQLNNKLKYSLDDRVSAEDMISASQEGLFHETEKASTLKVDLKQQMDNIGKEYRKSPALKDAPPNALEAWNESWDAYNRSFREFVENTMMLKGGETYTKSEEVLQPIVDYWSQYRDPSIDTSEDMLINVAEGLSKMPAYAAIFAKDVVEGGLGAITLGGLGNPEKAWHLIQYLVKDNTKMVDDLFVSQGLNQFSEALIAMGDEKAIQNKKDATKRVRDLPVEHIFAPFMMKGTIKTGKKVIMGAPKVAKTIKPTMISAKNALMNAVKSTKTYPKLENIYLKYKVKERGLVPLDKMIPEMVDAHIKANPNMTIAERAKSFPDFFKEQLELRRQPETKAGKLLSKRESGLIPITNLPKGRQIIPYVPRPLIKISDTAIPKAIQEVKDFNDPNFQRELADKVQDRLDQQRSDMKDAMDPVKDSWIKKWKKRIATGLFDRKGNVRKKLMDSGQQGKEAVMNMDLKAGTDSKVKLLMKEAEAKIVPKLFDLSKKVDKLLNKEHYKKWSEAKNPETGELINKGKGKNQYVLDLLNDLVQMRRTQAIESYKPGHKSPIGGIGFKTWEKQHIPKELLKELNTIVDIAFETTKKQLDRLYEEGMIDKVEYENLSKVDYIKRDFLHKIDKEVQYNVGGKKINTTSSGIEALTEGSYESLNNDVMSLLNQTVSRTENVIANNNAMKSLYDLAKSNPDNGLVSIRAPKAKDLPGGGKIQTKGKESAPQGYTKMEVKIDGKTESVYIKNEFAGEWLETGRMDPSTLNAIRTYSGANVLRTFATGVNPEFAVSNLIRDSFFDWMVAKDLSGKPIYSMHGPVAIGQKIRNLIKVAPDAFLNKGRYRDYIMEGGGMEFQAQYGTKPIRFSKAPGWNKLVDALSFINEKSEIVNRLALREQGIINGLTPKEATYASRNYMDFSQGGHWSKSIDAAVPYFNVSMLGLRNLARSAKESPGTFAYQMGQLTAGSIALTNMNRLWNPEAFDAIPEYEKNNNFIIATPFWHKDNEGRKIYYYARLPKEKTSAPLINLWEAAAERYLTGKNPSKRLLNTFHDFANQFNPVSLVTSSPVVNATYTYLTDYDTWRNKEIWKGDETIADSEKYYKDINPIWKTLSNNKLTQTLEPFMGGDGDGLRPQALKAASEKLFTSGNMWTELAFGSVKRQMYGMDEKQQEDLSNHYMNALSKGYFSRKIFRKTSPYGQEPDKKLTQNIKIESTKKHIEKRDIRNKIEEIHASKLTAEKKVNNIISFINESIPNDDIQKKEKLDRYIKYYQDYAFMVNLPEADKQFFFEFNRHDKSPVSQGEFASRRYNEKKTEKEKMDFLSTLGQVKGINNMSKSKFWIEFNRLTK